jgi:hypothetical protein
MPSRNVSRGIVKLAHIDSALGRLALRLRNSAEADVPRSHSCLLASRLSRMCTLLAQTSHPATLLFDLAVASHTDTHTLPDENPFPGPSSQETLPASSATAVGNQTKRDHSNSAVEIPCSPSGLTLTALAVA